jgi:hypothetical protein
MTIGGGDGLGLGDRAFVGDTATGALTGADGTIDWWAPGGIDQPPAFYRLLDPSGGAIAIAPAQAGRPSPGTQTYDDDSMVVRTVLSTQDARVEICDVAPWDGQSPVSRMVRLVTVLRGPVDIDIDLVPGRAFTAARDVSAWSAGVAFDGLVAHTSVPMELEAGVSPGARERRLAAHGRIRMHAGDRLVVTLDDSGLRTESLSPDRATAVIERTTSAWRRTVEQAEVGGPWAGLARRSLLVLRALSMGTSGALVSAPTTSLPEQVGGERNFDGRIVRTTDVATWARVAAEVGMLEEADAAAEWLAAALDQGVPTASVLGIDGDPPPSERSLPHLAGWRASQPVRVGSDAGDRLSAEPSAAILATATSLARSSAGISLLDRWGRLVAVADWVADHWSDRDAGIWDLRGTARPLLSPRLSARQALAGFGVLAWQRNPLDLDAAHWHDQRVRLEKELLAAAAKGRGGLTAMFGQAGDPVDASLLRVAWLGPWPAYDMVVETTIDKLAEQLSSGPWLHPYPVELDDGFGGEAGASVVATLWQARALAVIGRWEEANLIMEAVSALAGPLGLLPERVDPTTGEPLGNRPSAAAHLAFIEAALALAAGPA